jgi:Protein of unknown function (DUF3592)
MSASALIVVLLVIIAGLVALAVFRRRAVAQWPRITGMVSSIELGERDTSGGATDYFPMLNLTYQINGFSYQANRIPVATMSSTDREALMSKVRQKYPEGGQVTLAYDPKAPQRVTLA